MRKILNKFPDIKGSSQIVMAGGLQSLANILVLSICSRTYGVEDYSLIPLYFTAQSLLMVFSFQGMDSMINRAMLNNYYSFYKIALNKSLKFSILISLIAGVGLFLASSYFDISNNMIIISSLLIFQLPISSLEKVECGLLGLNKFTNLLFYKIFSAIIYLIPLIGCFFRMQILWIVVLFVISRLIIVSISLFMIKAIIRNLSDEKEEKSDFYISEAIKVSYLSGVSTIANYLWPLLLYKIDPISLTLFFNGNKIPEKIKDYSKLFVSIPSQQWLKSGEKSFVEKMDAKGKYIFIASVLISLVLIFLSQFFIPLIFGDKYIDSILISQIVLCGVPGRVLSSILQSREIFHEKNTSFFRKSNYIQLVMGFILAIPLVIYYKGVGLAIHSVVVSYLGFFISLIRYKFKREEVLS